MTRRHVTIPETVPTRCKYMSDDERRVREMALLKSLEQEYPIIDSWLKG
jgi:hypothetical protein